MARHEIQTITPSSPSAREQLERAVARLKIAGDRVVQRVDVEAPNGRLQIAMDLAEAKARAANEAERLFYLVWYDAFGDRTARHLSRFV
jgi:hypothetical protein